ncbi:MAG: methylenetetrahydrofolate reductase [Mycobacterium sp.]|jgi:methylenetetrahydrofolate reductase (NADPH)|nr:methylenetetrahydrofolate reductase [Mycobacterium sp.]
MTFQSAATTVEELVTAANVEVIPLRGADEKALAIPPASTITITCSPKFGLERTLEHVIRARESGHRVVPHLAARMVEDEAQLQRFLGILSSVGVEDLYVVGGDGADPVGKYSEAFHILEAIQELDHDLQRIGVGCYPEGHPNIAEDALVDALQRKQPYADYMVSQLCFDAATLTGWLRTMRQAGITLPVRIGVAAPLQTRKLIELSLKIGVGSSVKFLTKQHGFVGNLLLGRSYTPESLISQIVEETGFDELGIEGLHLFSFNQIDATVEWQRRIGAAANVSAENFVGKSSASTR